ncbi:MAG: helix-turn-helix transcriptional regulator [Stappiaceae bacterium]
MATKAMETEANRESHSSMTSEQFRVWRKSLGLKQKDAADKLGLKKRMIQYYEKGDRDGRAVEIPKAVRLACYALSRGVADFNGDTTIHEPDGNRSTKQLNNNP